MSQGVETLGKDTVKGILVVEGALILLIISYFFYLGYIVTALLALSGLMAGYIYSAEPVRIKKRGFWSPFPVLLGLYTLPVLGGMVRFQEFIVTVHNNFHPRLRFVE